VYRYLQFVSVRLRFYHGSVRCAIVGQMKSLETAARKRRFGGLSETLLQQKDVKGAAVSHGSAANTG